ncbi:probable cation-transporting ATPase 13A3 isoform X5 [Eurytemora carolleeae]|uniref:probable cation-transporting ATPase 13A3 isoform X5 n=1 Tax=Eurytemora carolleeae TaxID=1294199 RepID=UPI000C792C57|nr:probable cation-transporting ATPase 13A3 isoform X5 [Eurytemora carolleeae]|eukprot:XP_023338513.1 probable cation-transporting ATPase 13A3 isoform X5 [Eurytemora affinis]
MKNGLDGLETEIPIELYELGYETMTHSPSLSSAARSVIDKGTEDESTITGYRRNILKSLVSHFLSLVLCGIPYLLAKWKPRWRLSATCSICPIALSDRLLIAPKESQDMYIVSVQSELVGPNFPSRFSISTKQENGTRDTTRLLQEDSNTFKFFFYKHLKYGWDAEDVCFTRLVGLDSGTSICNLLEQFSKGLSADISEGLVQLHGENSIEVEIPSYLSLLVEEVLHPFYIFQTCSITLWSLDEYYYYALCIFIISLISVVVSLYETRRQAESLHAMVAAGGEKTCILRRGSIVEETDTAKLVPGDLIVLPKTGCTMSCDVVLLTGTAIVNEAMLTGESVPVTKSAVPHLDAASDEPYNPEVHNRHTIFAGTHVIQTRFYGDQEVVAVVVRTGFLTSKGELIRSILFPRPMDFKFYRDSVRFILVLFCIAAIGMVYCTYVYIKRGADISMILLRTLDIITIVVPPALPAAMTVGTVYAQNRLKKKGIFCISPARINVCGKLKLICFDKTGTLTEDGLDFKSVLPALSSEFQGTVEDITKLEDDNVLLWSLASCHSLTIINNQLQGDPLDAKMFEGTGWDLEEPGEDAEKYDKMMPTVVKPRRTSVFSMDALPLELGIIRQFPFSSSLARMSVIVRELSSSNFIIFTKGAPEKLEDICDPSSIPHDYHSKLKELTLQGYRVIALAQRQLDENVNWIKIQKMKRDAVENNLQFLGFLIMQNTLKPQTQGVISELKAAELKIVMITGDNLLTGLSVSRDSGIIDPGDRVVILDVIHRDETLCLEFQDAEGFLNEDMVDTGNNGQTAVVLSRKTHLAVSGKTWSILIKHFPDLVPRILVQGTVFARMSPDQKAHLVEELQTQGYIVSMCGDGANDCGALKAAHVGVSLSEAEASVAAPFTSKIPNISCIPTLILEGRCALVTSFGVFKYMALYSMIQFISILILYTNKTNLGDGQFLYIDLVITTTVAVLMGRTQPWTKLVKQRPVGSLISGQTLASIFCQILASLAGQLTAMFYLQWLPWYTPVFWIYLVVTQVYSCILDIFSVYLGILLYPGYI